MDADGNVPIPQGVGFELDWDFIEASQIGAAQLNEKGN